MKNILLPTDFSENAWNAVKYAVMLYKDQPCTFHLLNTYTPAIAHSRFMATPSGQVDDVVRSSSEQGLQRLVNRVQEQFGCANHHFNTISSFNLLIEEIKEVVELYNIDLVVTGTKGASGLEEVFMGSNTVRMIKSVKGCPVLAIPAGFEFDCPKEIGFATDFNRFYAESELRPVIELARTFKATLRIVYVQYKIEPLTEVQRFNLNMLRKYLGDIEHYVHTVSELNSVSRTLEVFSQELDLHLLAMLNYQHSYVEKMTREPVVKRIAFHTQVPLLSIPEMDMSASSMTKNVKENRNSEINGHELI
ncbi:universal stress protein [Sediminicola luteus]|uniref:Universal stress protein UspA n=1 Tax=Sediminicola luteus TaxID=319238 RepID=A0A2A4GG86_9FLAO|nr:universal stress protein [Sediminicola luteus]PCE66752.1 universal stress protein UspA [Sediminicola luteus]